jgi:hypothetical protein
MTSKVVLCFINKYVLVVRRFVECCIQIMFHLIIYMKLFSHYMCFVKFVKFSCCVLCKFHSETTVYTFVPEVRVEALTVV